MKESIERSLSNEVIRKLNLALGAQTADDRHIICTEVFNDVTGNLDEAAQEALQASNHTCFYEVLAPFYQQNAKDAEQALELCQQLWSNRHVVAIYALLLHQWLLKGKGASGSRASKLLVVLVTGSKQMFEVDTTNGTTCYHGLFATMAQTVSSVSETLGKSGAPASDQFLRLAAAYVPYYQHPSTVLETLTAFPGLSTESAHGETQMHDYMVTEIAMLLHEIKSVKALLHFMAGLEPLLIQSDEWKSHVGMVPLLRLQGELYSLTLPGGPRYCPSRVRIKALDLLNHAFPVGSRSRGIVRLLFRLMHPGDWPALIWQCLLGCMSWIRRSVMWMAVRVGGAFQAGFHSFLCLLRIASRRPQVSD